MRALLSRRWVLCKTMFDPGSIQLLPPGLSSAAADVDRVFFHLVAFSTVVLLAIVGALLVFVVRYRRRPEGSARPSPLRENLALELLWIAAITAVLVCFFRAGRTLHERHRPEPPDALVIHGVARQWAWEFRHPNGMRETNELIVPVRRPIVLAMESSDVVHGFSVPELRLGRDIVPGRITRIGFELRDVTGSRPLVISCGHYCGAPRGIVAPRERAPIHMIDGQNSNHATMLATLHGVSARAHACPFTHCDEGGSPYGDCEHAPDPRVCLGEKLYRSGGCSACHSTDPQVITPAPSFAGLWRRRRAFVDGSSAIADARYVEESIRDPQAHVVVGYASTAMPAGRFSERQLDALAAFVESLGE